MQDNLRKKVKNFNYNTSLLFFTLNRFVLFIPLDVKDQKDVIKYTINFNFCKSVLKTCFSFDRSFVAFCLSTKQFFTTVYFDNWYKMYQFIKLSKLDLFYILDLTHNFLLLDHILKSTTIAKFYNLSISSTFYNVNSLFNFFRFFNKIFFLLTNVNHF